MSFSPEFCALNCQINNYIRSNSNNGKSIISVVDAFAAINMVINDIHLFCNQYHSVNADNKRKLIRLFSTMYNKATEFSNTTTCHIHARLFRKQAKFIANTMDSLGYSVDTTPLRRSNRH